MQIVDIFSSIQGEGIYAGYKQIFIRFVGCNLSCTYCDENYEKSNYYELNAVLEKINSLNKIYNHSISITGGEPLLQVESLKKLIPELPLPVYLETNATLSGHLAEIKDFIDIFSLDFKAGYEKEFKNSIELVKNEDTFVKYILEHKKSLAILKKAVDIIHDTNKDIPLIIQPITLHRHSIKQPNSNEIMAAYNMAKLKLNDVRVIPQMHRILHLK